MRFFVTGGAGFIGSNYAGLAETIAWYRRNEPWWRPLKPRGASRTLDHGRPAGA